MVLRLVGLGVVMLYAAPLRAQLLINEIEANTPGSTDVDEFVELRNASPDRINLSQYVLVLYNGANDSVYAAYDLQGQLGPGGLYVLAPNPGNVPNTDQDISPDSHAIQNGADAVALYFGLDASSFPFGAPLTTSGLVDAIVYGVGDSDDLELLAALTPTEPQVDEELNGMSAFESMQRCGSGAFRSSAFIVATPTPGVLNSCMTAICGDGVVEDSEECDDGTANGTMASCCSELCELEPRGTACQVGDSGGPCDVVDRCDDSGQCQERFSSDTCRPARNVCDVAEVCTGLSRDCPEDTVLEGCCVGDAACDDANPCTEDACSSMTCSHREIAGCAFEPDAGPPDASTAVDASAGVDASTDADGGSPPDDAGSVDAGTPLDAGNDAAPSTPGGDTDAAMDDPVILKGPGGCGCRLDQRSGQAWPFLIILLAVCRRTRRFSR